MAVVIGVDSSTQSCTAEVYDAKSGRLLASAGSPHPVTSPPVSEQDPQAWWDALVAAVRAALAALHACVPDAGPVVALSVAGQCHGAVLLDSQGAVLRPAKLWNDTTSAPQSHAMVEEWGQARWASEVGSVPTAAFTVTKLAWIAQHEPAVVARTAHVLLPHDYLTYRLTGQLVTDRSEASGTCYYTAWEGRYRPDILEHWVSGEVSWDMVVPRVLGPGEQAGTLLPDAAAQLGLPGGLAVGAGAGDQHAGALGMGLRTGDVAVSLGTSGVVMAVSPDPVRDPTGWVNGVCDAAGGYLPLVCTLNATKVTDWARTLLGVGYEEFDALALAALRDSGPQRPVLAAYLDGERSPDRPGARGLLAGITPGTSQGEVALAAVEGVVLGLVEGLDAMRAAGVRANGDVVVTGGGAASAAYRQVLAEYVGGPVTRLAVHQTTARGAAMQAAAVAQGCAVTDVQQAWGRPVESVTEPGGAPPAEVRQRYRTLAAWQGMDRKDMDA